MKHPGIWLSSLEKTKEALFAVDSRQRITFWNAGARRLLGYSEAEVLGKPCYSVMGGRQGKRQWCVPECPVHRCVMSGSCPRHRTLQVQTKKGLPISIRVSFIVARRKKEPITIHLLQDASRQQRVRDALVGVVRALRNQGVVSSRTTPMNAAAQARGCVVQELDTAAALTRREMEVLKLVAEGLSTSGIASYSGISRLTARNHIQNAMRKLRLHSRAQLVSFAFRHSWL